MSGMKGWKTVLSGGCMILWGAYGLFSGKLEANEAMQSIMSGLAVIGLGHKLDKAGQ